VLPWLFNHVETFVEELNTFDGFSDVFLGANINECVGIHEETVK